LLTQQVATQVRAKPAGRCLLLKPRNNVATVNLSTAAMELVDKDLQENAGPSVLVRINIRDYGMILTHYLAAPISEQCKGGNEAMCCDGGDTVSSFANIPITELLG
jgi:hypothetical protein